MTFYRREQLASLIQQKLGEIIAKEVEFPQGVLATISDVTLSRDFIRATVWVSIIPGEAGAAVLRILEQSRGMLQRELGDQIEIRNIPKIEFALDRGPEHAARIEKLSLEKKEP